MSAVRLPTPPVVSDCNSPPGDRVEPEQRICNYRKLELPDGTRWIRLAWRRALKRWSAGPSQCVDRGGS